MKVLTYFLKWLQVDFANKFIGGGVIGEVRCKQLKYRDITDSLVQDIPLSIINKALDLCVY